MPAENTPNPSQPAPAPSAAPSPAPYQRRGPSRGRGRRQDEPSADGLKETVVAVNRVAKVVKGGKRFSFGAIVVVGDGNGRVGCGLGKAKDVQFSIQKGARRARKNMVHFTLVENTIPHETVGHWGAGKVWMKPAAPGTGVIAGGGVRAVLEAAGVKNILTKSLGSTNNFSVIYATIQALRGLRTRDEIMKLRGR
ncbi:MAG TPA: 30S ribosomal protein S5 [Elusimicrobia bacterium]|nr:30S ribosomal protein S5 [Elusimicrobiota bacterium]